jgi:hypothetical protein
MKHIFAKDPCNQQVEVRRKWQLGMHKKWQQECTGGVNIILPNFRATTLIEFESLN